MDYREIKGWFDFPGLYAERVQAAGDGAHFVEVGAWLGKSSCYLAEQIRSSGKQIRLDVVDTWQGSEPGVYNVGCSADEADKHGDLFAAFAANVEACGLAQYVNPFCADSVQASFSYADRSLDFVFIDGDHSPRGVTRDLIAWWPKIRPGGILAGHDYPETGPKEAVDGWAARIRVPVQKDGRCWMVRKPACSGAKVLLGLPHLGGITAAAARGAFVDATAGRHTISVREKESSLLAACFNQLWAEALNEGYTHFAMLHSDIGPQRWWLDLLIEEMVAEGVDMIGCVSPIKDYRGVTSTGLAQEDAGDVWSPKKRFTLRETCAMPATVRSADYDGRLLLNTGCWVADLRNPRWRTRDQHGDFAVYFCIRDRLWEHEGRIVTAVQSEDWFFSSRAQAAGLRLALTRKCHLDHWGKFPWPNDVPWGLWPDDEETRPLWLVPATVATSTETT